MSSSFKATTPAVSAFSGRSLRTILVCTVLLWPLLCVPGAKPVRAARGGADSPQNILLRPFVAGVSGRLSIEPNRRGGLARLSVSNLPTPQQVSAGARIFLVWATGNGLTVRLGELRTDARGDGYFEFTCPVAFERYGVFVAAATDIYAAEPGETVLATQANQVGALYTADGEERAAERGETPKATTETLAEEVRPLSQAQQRPRKALPEEVEDSEDVVRVDTDLVLVDVTVTDAGGAPVRNLRAEDFKIYEDGAERPISFFNVERRGGAQRPVAVVFAVDVSGSMTAEEMTKIGNALREFAKRMSEREAVFAVMGFGMNVKVHQTFTGDARKLDRAVERLSRDVNGLSTHTYDAVDDAIRLLVRGAPRTRERRLLKRAVVVVTDGFPVGDTVAPKTVIERANAADVSVYAVTLPSYSRLLASASSARSPLPTPLDVSGLIERTGGTSVYATDKDYGPLFKALAEEVTSTYILAFYPPEEKRRDGRTHTIRIEAPPGLHVRQSRSTYESSDK